MLHDLQARGVVFRSVADGIDTSTTAGKLLFGLLGSFAEFECNQISEQTIAGLCSARKRGIKLGRPRVLDKRKLCLARRLRRKNVSYEDIAEVGVGRKTVWRALN